MAIFAGKTSEFYWAGTKVGKSVTISGINPTVGEWDGTTLDDENVMAYPTLPDPGEVSVTVNLDLEVAEHSGLLTKVGTAATEAMCINFKSSASTNKFLRFDGWPKAVSISDATPTNYPQATFTIRLTSMPVWASSVS